MLVSNLTMRIRVSHAVACGQHVVRVAGVAATGFGDASVCAAVVVAAEHARPERNG